MNTPLPFTLTPESATVVVDGSSNTFRSGTVQYNGIRDCILREDWDKIPSYLTVESALANYLGDRFSVVEGEIKYDGIVVPECIATRIKTMAAAGESPAPLLAFYERLAKNPSMRSVQQLFDFLAHCGIPLQVDGTFLAYKGVRDDLLDVHSGTLLNEPGKVLTVPRNQVSDDPRTACHFGLHVGALSYASSFGQRVVICQVDPEHVVCVPYDYSSQKMRVCEYLVTSHWIPDSADEMMPATVAPEGFAEIEDDDPDWSGDVEYDDDDDDDDEYSIQAEAVEPEAPVVKAVTMTSTPTGPKAATFNRMTPARLMEQTIGDLRKYASAHLKIAGASHLPGGKSKLVSKILRARRKRSR